MFDHFSGGFFFFPLSFFWVTEQKKILKQITVACSLNQKDQQEQHCGPGKSQAVLMHPIDHRQLQPLPRKTEESRGASSEVRGGGKNEGGRKRW